MVIRLLSLLLLPILLSAGEFVATVSTKDVTVGEPFVLNLNLKEATAREAPFVLPLKNSFTIHSQQQSNQTLIVNGRLNFSTLWRLSLIPEAEGDVQIPSITIQTNLGTLSTEPILLHVSKGKTQAEKDAAELSLLTLTTHVSQETPFKNEPFVYTVRLTSRRDLTNITLQKIQIDEAIVDSQGEPKIYQKSYDGETLGVIEYNFHVTPLKSGPLKIPEVTLQGSMAVKRQSYLGSSFQDELDPFAMMSGFDRLKPFSRTAESIVVEVKPPVGGMNPWIPAKSLTLEESVDDNVNYQVGEPFTRSFVVKGVGIKSNLLPKDFQSEDRTLKVYADQPEIVDEIKDGVIKSSRKEQYTLIPQQPGTLSLPEKTIEWWDVKNNQKMTASIPARTLTILPSVSEPVAMNEDVQTLVANEEKDIEPISYLLYGVIGALVLLLVAVLLYVRRLLKQLSQKNSPKGEKKAVMPKVLPDDMSKYKPSKKESKKEKLPDLNPT